MIIVQLLRYFVAAINIPHTLHNPHNTQGYIETLVATHAISLLGYQLVPREEHYVYISNTPDVTISF